MKNTPEYKYLRYTLLVITGILLGWLFFHSPDKNAASVSQTAESIETIWTCSMHPQIRMHEPGKCPICGMDLIPLNQGGSNTNWDSLAVHLTPEAAQLANVMTSVVTRRNPVKAIRLYGKIEADERLLQNQTSHIPGRIEELKVNFTGEAIRKGQVLATIYSPELITAQQELIEASKIKDIQPEIYNAARERLLHWKLTEEQIKSIEQGKGEHEFDVVSNTSGVVIQRMVNNGDHVIEGTILFQVADLSKVWALFDAYESDLHFINKGAKLTFTVQALPGINFSGIISFIDPVIDPVTRVAKVRVEVNNQSGRLKPQMFITGTLQSQLNEYNNDIVIPKSSVLWTGERSIVYVKQPETDEPVFTMREVELGPSLGESYVITKGLNEGEAVVTQGAFSVDAAAQLEGKPSMMNTKVELTAGHDHGSMSSENTGVGEEFKISLTRVYEQYIRVKIALFESEPEKVKAGSLQLQESLRGVKMQQLSGDHKDRWMDIQADLNKSVRLVSDSKTLENQRSAFSNLSNDFYRALKTFGLNNKTVYYQYCPMANNDKGAYWLSESKPIRNPYFGTEMPDCGETKETLNF